MKTIEMKELDLKVYSETLDNGLQIFVIPKNNANNTYVTFTTKYGSDNIEFIPINKNKMIKTPLGIAHFLEHKLFEQSDGTSVFDFFSDRGSDANANTNQTKTTYLFSGPNYIEENINFLLNYVQSPYFTDENVSKEKGIIEQEIKMYEDDPDTILYESIYKNIFTKYPTKYPIIGDIENINKITKEDLYECYNTFYHPSNMFIVITGKADPQKAIDLIKKNQDKKNYKKSNKIKTKQYNEPNEVAKKSEVKYARIAIQKCIIGFKIKLIDYDKYKQLLYILTLFDTKYGATSNFVKTLNDEKIIKESLSIDFDVVNDYAIILINGISTNPEELLNRIINELSNLNIQESDFYRKKKTLLSSLIYASDNIFSLNYSVTNDIIKYNKYNSNRYNDIKSLNFEEFNKVINKLDLSHYSTLILNPNKE